MSIPGPLIRFAGSLMSRARQGRKLSILIYHRVLPAPDSMRPDEIDARVFALQMGTLASLFNVIPLSEAVRQLRQNRLPPRAVCITFDDGYADNESIALPILRRFALPATFFVATGYLNGGRMWNDTIIEAIRAADVGIVTPEGGNIPAFELTSESSRVDAIASLLAKLKYLPPQTRDQSVEKIVAAIDKSLPDDLMMTNAQVRALHDSGMEIGAHTVHHPILGTLDDDEARREIVECKTVIEDIIDAPVELFAYPNGKPGTDYDRRDVELVKSSGYSAAVSTAWGVSMADSDHWQLPRFTPWDRKRDRFALRLLHNCSRTQPAVA